MTDPVMIEIVMPQLVFWIYVMWGLILEMLIIMVCYFFMPIYRRAKTLSFLTRKAYGVVEVVGKGRSITRHLTNFYKDYAIVRGGIFYLDPRYVFLKEGARCIHFDEKDAFEPIEFTGRAKIKKILESKDYKKLPKDIRKMIVEDGIEKLQKEMSEVGLIDQVFLQPVDMKRKKPKEKIKDPQMINAMFMKQKAIAESEAIVKILQLFKILLIVAAGASVIALALGYLNYDTLATMAAPLSPA